MAETTLTADDRRSNYRAAPPFRGRRPSGYEHQDGARPAPAVLSNWQRWAACRELPKNVFFPPGRSESTRLGEERAKGICLVCPVRARCLEFALDGEEPFGVWGGLTTEERCRVVAAAARNTGEKVG